MTHSFTTPCSTKRAVWRGIGPTIATIIILGAGVLVPPSTSPAGASTGGAIAVVCGKQSRAVGNFIVSCDGSASKLVAVSVSLQPCASVATCTVRELQSVVALQGPATTGEYIFTGGSVAQLGLQRTAVTTGTTSPSGSTGAAGSTGVSTATTPASTLSGHGASTTATPTFRSIDFRYSLSAPGKPTVVLTVTVATAAHFGLTNPVLSIQDDKNAADGAAKSQPVE